MNSVNEYCVTFDELTKWFDKITNAIPRPTETDILLIKQNPNLNWWQKRKFIRQIKRIVAKDEKSKRF